MPIFQYECEACEKSFEEIFYEFGHENDIVDCPTCKKKDKVRKLLSVPARGRVVGGSGSGDADYNFRKLLDQRVQEGSAARAKDGSYKMLPGDA